MTKTWLWATFAACVAGMLALDLGVANRRAHRTSMREAALWSALWVGLAGAFGGGIAVTLGGAAALQFATGYVVEEALSIDNLFVFLLIFSFFRVPAELQHRVLFWGILGALGLRGAMIGIGSTLVQRFEWILYLFGAFLVVAGVRLGIKGEGEAMDPSGNPALKLVRRLLPVTDNFAGPHFFVRERRNDGSMRRAATPLFVTLAVIEASDLVFAVDSIPAIFGVTRDPFIVYTSNVFAILGLRSMYFVLAGVMDRFYYLRFGLAAVLTFVGIKMLIAGVWEIPTLASLAVIVGLLAIAVVASMLRPPVPAPGQDEVSSRTRA